MATSLTWHDVIGKEKEQPYFVETLAFVAAERQAGKTIYPPQKDVFNAFRYTELADVKVVILGQDPYHGPNQAHGLSFSVRPGVPAPPSLVNMYKELATDIPGFERPDHGYLQSWAEQGVLLLNTVLTVEGGRAHSHANLGWETFTDKVIAALNENREGVVFLLWGSHAQKKGNFIDRNRHHVLKAPHPSPLSAHRGFLGCRHFSQANQLLEQQGLTPIDWMPRLPHAPGQHRRRKRRGAGNGITHVHLCPFGQQQPQVLRILQHRRGVQRAVAVQPRWRRVCPERQQRLHATRLLRKHRPLQQRDLPIALFAQAILRGLRTDTLRIATRHRLSQRQIAATVKRRNLLPHLLLLSHHQ